MIYKVAIPLWILISALVSQAQVTPFNSWRVLVVFTGSIDSAYGFSSGMTLYRDYLASTFDGMNQVYEASGVDTRAQIAGVIYDKTYNQNYGRDRCEYTWDVQSGSDGMGRYAAMLDKYGADAIVLVHLVTDSLGIVAGGCSEWLSDATGRDYGSAWLADPGNVYLWVHEMGHIHNAQHCHGHRLTFDSVGTPLGGPSPNNVPHVLGIDTSGAPYSLMGIVETRDWHVSYGFYTTMAYEEGNSIDQCGASFGPDTNGGIVRNFRFFHHGRVAKTIYSPGFEWSGTLSTPAVTWHHGIAGSHPVGGGDSITYIDRLRYIGAPTDTYKDSTKIFRNVAALHQTNWGTIRDLKDIPASVTLTPDMSIGPTAADSQWLYAHIAATNSVTINPGFKVTSSGALRISVGSDPGALIKKGFAKPSREARTAPIESAFKISYDPISKSLHFASSEELRSLITVRVFDPSGRLKKEASFNGSKALKALSIGDLTEGVYVVRLSSGKLLSTRKFVKQR